MKDALIQDVRFALRSIRRDTAFFVFAVLIIGIGIGANTAVFSLVHPLLLRPLAFEDPEQLVWVANSGAGGMSAVTSRTSNLRDYRRLNTSFEALTGYNAFFGYDGYNLVGDGEPQRLIGVNVARNFLEVLGVPPALGRNFVDEESIWNGRRAVILSHQLWRRRFAADPDVVGREITLNSEAWTVVGVLPVSFDFGSIFSPGTRVDLLVPFPISDETDRWGNTLSMIGRLRPGVTIERAQAELDLINQQLEQAEPDRWGLGARVSELQAHITSPIRRSLVLLACAVGLVLLIACSNLSGLLLARSSARQKEIAVRSALGAGRGRLIRQMLTESLVISGGGALAGAGLAVIATRAVAATTAIQIPLLQNVAVDGTALSFTVFVAGAAGLLFGIAPALSISKGHEAEVLGSAGRGASDGRARVSVREALVVSEVALALVLLIGAGLLLRSFLALMDVELGFRPESALAWEIEPGRQFESHAARAAFHERLVGEIERVPGIESAGLSDTLPLGRNRSWGIRAQGEVYEEGEYPSGFPRVVDPGYIRTMRIPLVAGRHFTEADTGETENVIIVSEALAARLWPARDPIGQTMSTGGNNDWRVVGVVGNVRHSSLEKQGALEMYLPMTQAGYASMQLVVRGALGPEALVPLVRDALRSAAPAIPSGQYQTLGQIVDRAVSPRRFILLLLGAFAAAALVLAALGIYGVLSYSVGQRTREIAIRMAMGASAGRVQSNVVVRTVSLTAIGVAIGGIGSIALSRAMASLLYGVQPTDPTTIVLVVLLMFVIAGVAAYVPSRRAARIEPMAVLRSS